MNRLLFPLILLFFTASAYGGVYKWVDSKGKVHYGDQPPTSNNANARKLNIETSPSPATADQDSKASPTKSTADKEQEFQKRRVEKEEAQKEKDKKAAEAKMKQENCVQARGNLRALQEAGRISQYNEKGERVYLDDAARKKSIEDAQKSVDSWCN